MERRSRRSVWLGLRVVAQALVGALVGMFIGGALGMLAAYLFVALGGGPPEPTHADEGAFIGILAALWAGVIGLVVGAAVGSWLGLRARRSAGAGRAP
jgi:hypothetical protein